MAVSILSTVATLIAAAFLSKLFFYFRSPLRKYPGPFLAGWTDLWRLYQVWRGQSHLVALDLHRKYGPIVRIGPNVLDLDMPELIKTIYNIKGDWKKTPFYHGSSAKANGKILYNLFSQTDPELHSREKRPISKFYSMQGVLPLEPHMDRMIDLFCEQLEKRFIDGPNAGKTCDLGDWLLYYCWDVVGTATFSQPVGYLEQGRDFDGTLYASEKALDYFCVVGQIPILDHFFDKNPVYRIGPPSFGTITGISVQHLIDRYQGKDTDYHDPSKPDFLDKFIEAKKLHPDVVDDGQIISYLMINMIAGADTTAITLRSCIYYALKDPRVWKRLVHDIREATAGTTTKFAPTSFQTAHSVPYLQAVVREAMRMHPGVGMILERYVPSTGLCLPSNLGFLPGGVTVGMNPWVICRNTSVYGDDAGTFRPERWLQDTAGGESEAAFAERLQRMNSGDLTFGGGSRICIGKHMGLLEVYKVLGTLISLYDIELAAPAKDWTIINSWFVRQEGLEVKLSKRTD